MRISSTFFLSCKNTTANYSNQRKELERILDFMTTSVMVAFFTLAGAALDLESLSQTIMISTVIFLGRIGAIIVGSWLGGWMAGDPPKYNRSYSLGFVTQAGVTLGLAKKIHLENRGWGGEYSSEESVHRVYGKHCS